MTYRLSLKDWVMPQLQQQKALSQQTDRGIFTVA